MYCPQCGQERISEATSFCSRCGYLLTGTAELMKTGGTMLPAGKGGPRSPRSRGIRMGLFIFLLMFAVAPIVGLLSRFGFGIIPWPMGIVVFLLGAGGILRMIYALMFESNDPYDGLEDRELPAATNVRSTSALPPQRDIPASEYVSPAGSWRDTETQTPASVTETTTKLLEKDPDRQS